jgi:hypothetical protein
MAKNENKELWEQGECSLFKARMDRRKADSAKRKAGRKALKAEDVKMEWEPINGVWFGSLCTQELGFDNRIIEVDCHIYPPHSHSVTHKHNEAIIIILRGTGYSILDGERIDWNPAILSMSVKACGISIISPATNPPWRSRSNRYRCKNIWEN